MKTPKAITKAGLTGEQERFTHFYVNDPDCFMNQSLAYSKAYGLAFETQGERGVCAAASSRLLRNERVLRRVNERLAGLSDMDVDAELGYVIKQRDELGPKVQAVRVYNELKKRISAGNLNVGAIIVIQQEQKEKLNRIIDLNG